MVIRSVAGALALATLSGCAMTPQQYETTPVLVQSAMGQVTCQLYTLEQVTWDRAINRPAAMSVATADNLCRAEGQRVMQGGTPNYAPTVAAASTAQ
ncbi:hypothetical protein FQV27_06280 [Paracoccus aurantiacus]|uniref:Uncharacterized protein n=1 Tax=Paracoccus aurantiacus TaxID=2599412 RepID=A0A5C6S5L2_9RHOB|nr:hypothetical protein [Paracoccus aurantiacus]TXB69725.1 hypothetical protein FQV27_06280 [Paracoccus aurantiacus]